MTKDSVTPAGEHQCIKICITGGPSGGKTTLIEALKRELGLQVTLVPETASILYRGGFPRGKSETSLFHTQRAIFFTQKELEEMIVKESKSKIVVCDRGSLDGIAYWPWGEQHFLNTLGTSRETELKRYDWVIHMDTASHEYYDGTNPIRTESHQEAVTLNQKVHSAWENHPRRIVISSKNDFLSKMKKSITVVEMIMDGQSFSEILATASASSEESK